jgi:AcrR family transcriptional regulator
MARIVKDYDERKAELLETAKILFMKKGYEDVSINMIIDVVGVSKGAFYHYFNSKEELLDELVDVLVKEALQINRMLFDNENLTPFEKIQLMFQSNFNWKVENAETTYFFIKLFYQTQNLYLRDRFYSKINNQIVPMLVKEIEAGNKMGDFNCPYPYYGAQFLLNLGNGFIDHLVKLMLDLPVKKENIDEILGFVEAYIWMYERFLGIEKEKLCPFDDNYALKIQEMADGFRKFDQSLNEN